MRPARRTAKGRRRQLSQELRTIPRPLSIPNVAINHVVKLRYVATADATVAVSYRNLLDSILIATSATTGVQLFDIVKVRKVELWCYNPSGVATVSVHFVGRTDGSIGDDKAHTDTSMGLEPAYLSIKPDPKSQASQFQQSSAAVAFNVYCPIATVIDLHLSFRTAMEGNSATSVQQALVSGSAGLVYYRGFDGLATSSTKFGPKGTPQII
jgi:hypothetical protein